MPDEGRYGNLAGYRCRRCGYLSITPSGNCEHQEPEPLYAEQGVARLWDALEDAVQLNPGWRARAIAALDANAR
jgi:hypothetical protein